MLLHITQGYGSGKNQAGSLMSLAGFFCSVHLKTTTTRKSSFHSKISAGNVLFQWVKIAINHFQATSPLTE